jgi:hypothetical protein
MPVSDDLLERGHERKVAHFGDSCESLHRIELGFVSAAHQSGIPVEYCRKSIQKCFNFVAIAAKPTHELESSRPGEIPDSESMAAFGPDLANATDLYGEPVQHQAFTELST